MAVSATHAVESENFAAFASRFRFRPEIELDGLPSVAALGLQTEARGRFVTTMHHAVFAPTVARDSIDDTVFVPLHFLEQLGVARVMPIRHEVAGAFPSANVPRRDRPC